MGDAYQQFIASKAPKAVEIGFEPGAMPSHLFAHQKACIEHNLRTGSAGLFLDTGLGKTACELEWAVRLGVTPTAIRMARSGRTFKEAA